MILLVSFILFFFQIDLVQMLTIILINFSVVREAFEVVTVCVALNGGNIAELLREAWMQNLLVQLIIVCPNPQVNKF